MRSPTLALIVLAICTASTSADALLLVGKSKKVAHPATRVVVVREGDKTLLAVQPRYVGPAEKVALLVPVPKASSADVATLSPAQVDRLDQVSGPRVAELWEQDPCEIHVEQPDLDGTPPKQSAAASPAAPPELPPGEPGWKKEVLDGKSGAEVVAALEKAGFVVPDGSAAMLDTHLASGSFIFATFDAPKGGDGGVLLPPLRVEYDAKDFSLPSRLAALRGEHDLTAYVLSSEGRFEAVGQPNQGLPTNLDVVAGAKAKLPVFYEQLGDYVLSKKPEALVTEYAWSATSCEGCAVPLGASDLAVLGAGLLPSAKTGKQAEVLVEAADVSAAPDGPADVRQRLATCYGKALAGKPGLAGEVSVDVKTGAGGEVTSADAKGDADAALKTCATDTLKGAKLGKNNASGTAKLTFSPMSRDYLASYVLTRLHARFAKTPDKDIMLRHGSPLEGGRELGPEPNEAAPARAYASETTDNYQARYVVRHAWAGKIDCTTPKRGVWGEPPAGDPKGGPAPSTSGSAAPSAGPAASAKAPSKPKGDKGDKGDKGNKGNKGDETTVAVVTWLASGKAPELQPFAIDLPAGTAKPLAPKPAAPSAAPAPAPAPSSAAPPPPPPADGCGCGVPASSTGSGLAALLAAAVGIFARRARRRCPR